MTKHTNEGPSCPSCEAKLQTAHPKIAAWFRNDVKRWHQDCHISWAWRGKKEQNEMFAEHKSNAPWPKSPHNHMEADKPCSLALDFFKLCSNSMASWEYKYCRTISEESAGLGVKWGGEFKKLGDYCHFEIEISWSHLR